MKLSKAQEKARAELVIELAAAEKLVRYRFAELLSFCRRASDDVNEAIRAYNISLLKAEAFATAIAEDFRSDYEDKSERWQEGEAGQQANDFIEEWEGFEGSKLPEVAILEPELEEEAMPRRSAGQPADGKPVAPERPADFDRLPKRYKKYISELEQRLSALQRLADADSGSLVWLEAYGIVTETRHLPSESRVVFSLPSGEVEVRIDSRRNGEALEVQSSHGRLLILPDCSNQIGIKVGRHS